MLVNDTFSNINELVVRSSVECRKMNMVTGPRVVSKVYNERSFKVTKTSPTNFIVDTLKLKCRGLFTSGKWLSAKVTIYLPEVKKGFSFYYNTKKDEYSENAINAMLRKDLDKLLMSDAVEFF